MSKFISLHMDSDNMEIRILSLLLNNIVRKSQEIRKPVFSGVDFI